MEVHDVYNVIKKPAVNLIARTAIFKKLVYEKCNQVKYGLDSPRYAERIWINPEKCLLGVDGLDRRVSGQVFLGDWPPGGSDKIFPVEDLLKIRCCYEHWLGGVSWENTGIYQHMESLVKQHGRYDGCRNMDDIVLRYRQLDLMFNQVKKDGKLLSCSELGAKNFRELGGIYIHIGPEGETFFGCGGCHRFAIAKILELNVIPAQLGGVHISSIPYLPVYRCF